MSIRSVVFAPAGALVAVLLCGAGSAQPAAGGSQGADRMGPLLERAREAYAEPEPERERPADCPESTGNEIVVCAPIEQDSERFRVQSRLKDGDDSHLSWSGEAPDVAGPGIFKGKPTFSFGSPPPPAYIIDFSTLPEAPPGSDADRIGRGLAPRGSQYDDGVGAAQGDGNAAAGQPEPGVREPEGR